MFVPACVRILQIPRIIAYLIRLSITLPLLTMIMIGSGIGKACALLLAKEGAASVLVADIAIDSAKDVAAECKAAATNNQFRAEAIQVDITQEDSVRSLMVHMVKLFDRMDYCINCAGVSTIILPGPHPGW